ncbi:MAG: c-type cytochrome domain-containing protein [Prosthecobacter sp.]
MSHGSKFLTEKAPEPLKSQMIAMEKWILSFVEQPKPETPEPALTAASADKLVFADLIQPIFAAKCNKCHGEEKQKGELRLDTYEFTMQGGENSGDKNIVPGKPEDSVSMQLILLPEDDDEHMPPEGKDQLTKEETAIIQWWIQQGASNTQKLDLATLPAELKATAEAVLK